MLEDELVLQLNLTSVSLILIVFDVLQMEFATFFFTLWLHSCNNWPWHFLSNAIRCLTFMRSKFGSETKCMDLAETYVKQR